MVTDSSAPWQAPFCNLRHLCMKLLLYIPPACTSLPQEKDAFNQNGSFFPDLTGRISSCRSGRYNLRFEKPFLLPCDSIHTIAVSPKDRHLIRGAGLLSSRRSNQAAKPLWVRICPAERRPLARRRQGTAYSPTGRNTRISDGSAPPKRRRTRPDRSAAGIRTKGRAYAPQR